MIRSHHCWLWTMAVVAATSSNHYHQAQAKELLQPKYLAEPVVGSRCLKDKHHAQKRSEVQQSKSFLVPGSCDAGTQFEFPLSSGNGNGMVCATVSSSATTPVPHIHLETRSMEEGYIINYAGNQGVPNCFGLTENESSIGLPFVFQNVPPQGTTVQVTCKEPQTFVIVVMDDVGDQEGLEITGSVEQGVGKYAARELIQPRLLNPSGKITKVQVEAYGSALKGMNKVEKITDHVKVDDSVGEMDDMALEDDSVGDIAVVQYEVQDEGGNTVHRTHVVSTPKAPLEPNHDMELESMFLTKKGDLKVVLSGLPSFSDDDEDDDRPLLCTIRLGLVIENVQDESLVDVSAMINRDMPFLVVHGGWVRKRLHELGLSNKEHGWDLVLEDAHCEDPKEMYQITTALHENSRGRHLRSLWTDSEESTRGRLLLSASPTEEELQISEDMLVGRKPELTEDRDLRVSEHRFILVHGWCSDGNSWPSANFNNGSGRYKVVKFQDLNKNYNHDEFARAIKNQVCPYSGGSVAGNIVAHSQGGAAAVHLYNYYYSCLDRNTNSGKLIQTVGTPFQGTALAGTVALLGGILGVGCGSNNDLSDGAIYWVNRLSSWAKAKTTYYRTQYEEKFWRYDYCNELVHAVIGWPDDGAVEVSRGVLPGGVNGGVTEKQCHSRDMRDPPQMFDRNRNLYMTASAAIPR